MVEITNEWSRILRSAVLQCQCVDCFTDGKSYVEASLQTRLSATIDGGPEGPPLPDDDSGFGCVPLRIVGNDAVLAWNE